MLKDRITSKERMQFKKPVKQYVFDIFFIIAVIVFLIGASYV